MSIPVTCPHCRKSFAVKDVWAGKRGKCPHCQAEIQVPAPTEKPPAQTVPAQAASAQAVPVQPVPVQPAVQPQPDPAAVARQVLEAFQGSIEPVQTPMAYLLGLLLVAVVMVILPLVYLGLIGLVGYGMYLHVVHGTALFGSAGGRAGRGALLLYVAPLVAGGLLLLFMVKPLFARPGKRPPRRSLAREGEPLLFAFVDRVCDAVGAPRPRRIDVDCQVNASASFRRGLWSMLGSDLVLTIGMPLVAGLSLRQFAGVLAHEFGHFSQGAGMRLTYVVRSISWWFTRVVYERDAWDDRLVQWAQGSDSRIAIVLHLTRFLVWLSRRILWVLMMIGHTVSGFMVRQMEFDADRHEARLAGSDTFESTARQLAVLGLAYQGAQADLRGFYKEGRLADNLPKLVLANVGQIPPEVLGKLRKAADEATTGLFDTHPCDRDRIAAARRENAAGIFRLEQPAWVLFRGFDPLSVAATRDFYHEIFGDEFDPRLVHPIDDLLARQGKDIEGGKALGRYFQGAFTALRPLPVPDDLLDVTEKPKELGYQVKAARERMLAAKAAYQEAYQVYDRADTQAMEADVAGALLDADFKVRPTDFSLPMPTAMAVREVRTRARAEQGQAAGLLEEFERAASDRLFSAVELFRVPQVAARLPDAARWQQECDQVLPALKLVADQLRHLLGLRNEFVAAARLLGNVQGNEGNETLIAAIRGKMVSLRAQVDGVRQPLQRVRYPFDHAKGDISIGDCLVERIPAQEDLGGIMSACESLLETLPGLYVRLVGRLVMLAEEIEGLLGLPRLPEPPPPPQEAATA